MILLRKICKTIFKAAYKMSFFQKVVKKSRTWKNVFSEKTCILKIVCYIKRNQHITYLSDWNEKEKTQGATPMGFCLIHWIEFERIPAKGISTHNWILLYTSRIAYETMLIFSWSGIIPVFLRPSIWTHVVLSGQNKIRDSGACNRRFQ